MNNRSTRADDGLFEVETSEDVEPVEPESELGPTGRPLPDLPEPTVDDVARALFALTAEDGGPSLSRYLAKRATGQQALEFLVQRSIYTLREADPHSWAIPRLTGRPKAALVEIQSDEYGGGRPDRVHAEVFAKTMRGRGSRRHLRRVCERRAGRHAGVAEHDVDVRAEPSAARGHRGALGRV